MSLHFSLSSDDNWGSWSKNDRVGHGRKVAVDGSAMTSYVTFVGLVAPDSGIVLPCLGSEMRQDKPDEQAPAVGILVNPHGGVALVPVRWNKNSSCYVVVEETHLTDATVSFAPTEELHNDAAHRFVARVVHSNQFEPIPLHV